MDSGKALAYFKQYFKLSGPSESGWWRLKDPFDHHSDNSMAVNFFLNEVRGYRTGFRGTIKKFIREYENADGKQVDQILDEYEVEYLEPVKLNKDGELNWPDYYIPLYVYNRIVYQYLIGRNFNIDYLCEKGFGYCTKGYYAYRLIIPFYVDGKMIYWQARTVLKHVSPKYLFPSNSPVTKSQLLFNQDIINWEKKIYINEGSLDAIMYDQCGVATSGWKISITQMELLRQQFKRNIELIVVADKGFYKQQVAQWLPFCDDVRIKVLNLDNVSGKDTNDIGLKKVLTIERHTDYLTLLNLIELI